MAARAISRLFGILQVRSVAKIADTSSVGGRRKTAVVVRIHQSAAVAGSLTENLSGPQDGYWRRGRLACRAASLKSGKLFEPGLLVSGLERSDREEGRSSRLFPDCVSFSDRAELKLQHLFLSGQLTLKTRFPSGGEQSYSLVRRRRYNHSLAPTRCGQVASPAGFSRAVVQSTRTTNLYARFKCSL